MSEDARKDLAVLRSLTEQLSEARPLEDALRAVTDAALDLVPAGDHASIRLLDGSRTQLLASARSGKGSERRSLTLTKGEGVAGWVLEHGLPAHVKDARKDFRFMEAVGQGFAIGSMLAEPLKSAGEVIGVLCISSAKHGAFGQDDEGIARLLANCSVPPIERARLERLAAVDDLTLALNATFLLPRLREELERARPTGAPVSLLRLDLDGFQGVGASFGRALADQVLRLFAERVRVHMRPFDALVRVGKDEFALVMPGTDQAQAREAAERVRAEVGEKPMEPAKGGFLTQTVSIGAATSWEGATAEGLAEKAERALRTAKEDGKNRVVVG